MWMKCIRFERTIELECQFEEPFSALWGNVLIRLGIDTVLRQETTRRLFSAVHTVRFLTITLFCGENRQWPVP